MLRSSLSIALLITLFLSACSSSIQKVELEIPPELQDKPEVTTLLNEMATTVNKTRSYSGQIIKITGGKDVENAEELTSMQKIKLARIALQMMRVANEMEKYNTYADSLRQGLSPQQVLAFDALREKLKISMGDADMEKMGISREEMLAFKEQQAAQNAQNDSIEKSYAEGMEQMKSEGFNDESADVVLTNNSDNFKYWHLLIPLAVIVLFIYFIVRFVKRITSRFRNIRNYGLSDIKEDANNAFDKFDDLSRDQQHDNKKAEIDEMRKKFNTFFDNKLKS